MRRLSLLAAIAAGIAIVAVAVASADLPYRLKDGSRITIVGQLVCLPHKQGLFCGTNTDECATGFKSSDGRHFAFRNFDQLAKQERGLAGALNKKTQFQVSGQFSYGPDEQYKIYDIAGMLQVDSVRRVALPPEVS